MTITHFVIVLFIVEVVLVISTWLWVRLEK